MRWIVLTLLVALPSLAFAPAPFPKAERPARESEETRLVRECDAQLRELGVKWELRAGEGAPHVRFEMRNLDGGGTLDFIGSCPLREGGLPAALAKVLGYVRHVKGRR